MVGMELGFGLQNSEDHASAFTDILEDRKGFSADGHEMLSEWEREEH